MIEIIPAIDLIEGKCVRLTHGDFDRKTIYSDDPVEIAKGFEAAGLRRLHMVDLDGARTGRPANLRTLERVAAGTTLSIDFGGGVKTKQDLESVFEAGAAIANIGSLAVKEPDTFFGWLNEFGGSRILLGADCRDGKVSIDGWQTDTAVRVIDFLSANRARGVQKAFVTDIGRDGAMSGPSLALYERILQDVAGLELVASGGVSSIGDVEALDRIGCAGVIIGKAIYEGRVTLKELSPYAG